MNESKTCRGCSKPLSGIRVRRGRCRRCYYQLLKDHKEGRIGLSEIEGNWPPRTFTGNLQASRASANECWEWTGELSEKGYGRTQRKGRYTGAHRAVYEHLVGPIPEGLVLDHLCRNPPCVNPAHLEPVTNRDNILRGIGVGAINAQKTHCIRGHEFTPENTLRLGPNWPGGPDRRACRTCRRAKNREAMRAWRARSRQKETAS
ncbi:HNH endonuclease signature motif containing protein [Streptomyces smyrnaeus]|uniref:HNH endonuclease signature motif containing protein n=1 Tax=Streptomyces smyrnaeus TaxID=1387713 RepID=UPI0033E7ECE8